MQYEQTSTLLLYLPITYSCAKNFLEILKRFHIFMYSTGRCDGDFRYFEMHLTIIIVQQDTVGANAHDGPEKKKITRKTVFSLTPYIPTPTTTSENLKTHSAAVGHYNIILFFPSFILCDACIVRSCNMISPFENRRVRSPRAQCMIIS